MELSDDADIVNPDDFKSIQIQILMTNETSKTRVMKGKRIYGDEARKESRADVTFLEFIEKGLILEVLRPSCEVGHSLTLSIHVSGIKNELQFEVSAKVAEVEHLPEDRDRVTATLVSYDDFFWNAFQSVFRKRQEEVSEFFFTAKG